MLEFIQLNEELQQASTELSQKKLDKLITTINIEYRKRFKKSGRPKYGSLNMAFSDAELGLFFSHINNEKYALLFKFQAILGLRIGEACRVKLEDIDFATREISIFGEKHHLRDALLIPEDLFREVSEYAVAHARSIADCEGYLFFKDSCIDELNEK